MSNLTKTGFLCTGKIKAIVESAEPFCRNRNISGLIYGPVFKSHEGLGSNYQLNLTCSSRAKGNF